MMESRRFICQHCKSALDVFKGADPVDEKIIYNVYCKNCYCRGPKGSTKIEAFDYWFDMVGLARSNNNIVSFEGIEG